MDRLFYVEWKTPASPISPAQAKQVFSKLIWQSSQGRVDSHEKAGDADADGRLHARVNRGTGCGGA
ncbi:hypothetical protein C7445_10494 [Alicyclobacillus sacchari]|uniref:Uncharacterized protein n=1 Tax=Alicyclobacillus sacchari TaxID=392010 RepID=A0A4R8LPY9_9BACL|nr:hypothetical protein C7445_10494 [Alicyclobacillus sacchari]GMA58546.1 hypothetical protein GCM10025858_30490 [Alicyclobacillus sacchari]